MATAVAIVAAPPLPLLLTIIMPTLYISFDYIAHRPGMEKKGEKNVMRDNDIDINIKIDSGVI